MHCDLFATRLREWLAGAHTCVHPALLTQVLQLLQALLAQALAAPLARASQALAAPLL